MPVNEPKQDGLDEGFDPSTLLVLPKCPKHLVNLFGEQNIRGMEKEFIVLWGSYWVNP
ncbi:MAG: hypothetical protein WC269_05255 [Candidatus Gracilibacteria bacterium]